MTMNPLTEYIRSCFDALDIQFIDFFDAPVFKHASTDRYTCEVMMRPKGCIAFRKRILTVQISQTTDECIEDLRCAIFDRNRKFVICEGGLGSWCCAGSGYECYVYINIQRRALAQIVN